MENASAPDGKCLKCKSQKSSHYYPFFFARKKSDKITGAYFVPLCSSCILKKRIFSLAIGIVILFAVFAAAQILFPKYEASIYGVGIIFAFILIFFLTRPNIDIGSDIAGNLLKKELSRGNTEVAFSGDVKKHIRHNWHKIKKYFVCPGCHRVIKGQPSECPECGYILPKIMPSL